MMRHYPDLSSKRHKTDINLNPEISAEDFAIVRHNENTRDFKTDLNTCQFCLQLKGTHKSPHCVGRHYALEENYRICKRNLNAIIRLTGWYQISHNSKESYS